MCAQSCPTLCDSMDCSLPGDSLWNFPGKNWHGLPFPSPGDLPDPGIKPAFLVSAALAGRFFATSPPGINGVPQF